MTKEMFIKVYDVFVTFIKQEVNDEYVMNASAHLIDYCGGYELEIRPQCLLWGGEIGFLCALTERLALSLEVRMYEGVLSIR